MNNNQNQLPALGVLGATSFVGRCLLPQLSAYEGPVVAFSRREGQQDLPHILWRRLDIHSVHQNATLDKIPHWICLMQITFLPDYFALLEEYGVQRIVALSSTSRYTKDNSRDSSEQLLAIQLREAEEKLQAWALQRGVEWVVLRPTLIYGLGQDKNVSEIARFIRRFNFFPLFGRALGLRQPIHVQDVAKASLLALQSSTSINRAYNISGAEVISYRDMVMRIFFAMGRRPRFFNVPLWLFSMAVRLISCLPRYRKWSSSMAERMNSDMVFDHDDAARDFRFQPRGFELSSKDVPN